MKDRELLELAARAAGFSGVFDENTGDIWRGGGSLSWNSLKYDGDALRLAVKLGIEIHPDLECEEVVAAFCVSNPKLVGLNTVEEFDDDPMLATRRAITRAAAEIQLEKEKK